MDRLPDDESTVALVEFKGNVYVATNKRVYVWNDGMFVPLAFQDPPPPEQPPPPPKARTKARKKK